MSFKQNMHIDENVEERIELSWDFRPSSGYVNNQKYCVMSIVAPNGTNQTSKEFGIKIFGCFETVDQANDYAKALQGESNAFDYYTVETQCWAKLPPTVAKLDDQIFCEDELMDLKNTVIKNRVARAKMLEERILADKADCKKRAGKALEAAKEEAITEESAEATAEG